MHAKALHLSTPWLDCDEEDKMLDVRVWPRLETDQTELRKLMANSGCRQLGVLELCK